MKIGVVILLVLAVTAVIVVKKYSKINQASTSALPETGSEEAVTNPLERALKTGRPVVADFGRGKCIPCKMMKPILEELMQTYKGKAEIFIFDIDEYSDLTTQYGIQMIPTQIFFDKSGKEVMRHEGFFPKEEIVAKLEELGAN